MPVDFAINVCTTDLYDPRVTERAALAADAGAPNATPQFSADQWTQVRRALGLAPTATVADLVAVVVELAARVSATATASRMRRARR